MHPRLSSTYRFLLTLAFGLTPFFSLAAEVSPPYSGPGQGLAMPNGSVVLVIAGRIDSTNIGDEAHFDEPMLQDLPATTLHTHTVITDGVQQFDGVLMRDLLDLVGARGDKVRALALNNYSVDIPIRDFHDFDVLLATHMNGQRLLAHNKGPLWIIYPRDQHRELQDLRYDYRWVWQLHRLTVQ